MSGKRLLWPLILGVLLASLPLLRAVPGNQAPKEKVLKESLARVSLQVSALQVLYYFKATPDQLQELARLAQDSVPRPRDRDPIEPSEKYRKTLIDLRQALFEGDEEQIAAVTETLKEIQEDETADLDDAIEVVPAARRRVPAALKLFNARQLAVYLGSFGNEFPDPLERLQGGFEDARALKDEEWDKQRKALAELVGWLVAGLDQETQERVEKEAAELLDQVHDLKDDAYKGKKADLEKAARKIAGKVAATAVLRHYLERDLAELLSNPELPGVLEARLKKPKKDQENQP
jgi:hypothetical protein